MNNTQRNATICAAYIAGESLSSIGRRHGITRAAIWLIKRDAGVVRPVKPLPPPKMTRRELCDYRYACIRLAYQGGMTPVDISPLFSMTPEHIRSIIRDWKADPVGVDAKDKAAIALRKTFGEVSILKEVKPYSAANPDRDQEICQAYQAGLETVAVAAQFNLSRPRIYKILQQNQVQIRNAQPAWYSDVARDDQSGHSAIELAAKYGTFRQNIHKILRDLDVQSHTQAN